MGLLVVFIVYTGINSLVYNWVYLGRVYDKPYNKWALVQLDILIGYWHWFPGKLLCIFNIILALVIVLLWCLLKKSLSVKVPDSKDATPDEKSGLAGLL